MRAPLFIRPAALVLAGVGAGVGCTAAHAEDTIPLTLSVDYTVEHDDNPLRVGEDYVSSTGAKAPDSEQTGITTLGVLFSTRQGLQQFELQGSVVNYRYANGTSADFTATNVFAAWRWAVTPQLRGTLSLNQQERPNAENADNGDTSPNQRTQTNYRADAAYHLGGGWYATAGASTDKTSQQFSVTGEEFSSRSLDAGVRYEAASGSQVQARIKTTQGDYLNSVSTSLNPQDSGFDQVNAELRVLWAFTAASSVDVFTTALARSHPSVTTRDFSGVNAGASLLWATSAKTSLRLRYQRDLAAYATADSNYSETDLLAWEWNWQISAKTRLRVGQNYSHITYRGSPTGGPSSSRRDDTRDSRIALVWQPRLKWELSAGLNRIARDSTVTALGYRSNQIRFTARFNF